jgi:hypothetical protein
MSKLEKIDISSPTAFCLIASFCAVAYWMSIELLVLVYVTFKRRSGIYFWAIIVTTLGIILQTTGYILKSFENSCPHILVVIICKVGWVSNVSGFSIVLWSRLHLVVNDERFLKFVLFAILTDGFLCHTPIIVFEFGLISKHHSTYFHPMEIMERIQQTIFTVQETAISSLYIYHTARFLNNGYATQTRKVVTLLVAVQVTVVALDILLTVFDYNNMFTLKCTIHPFVYSVKLKLEFIVLNQLQQIVKRGLAPGLNLKSLSSSEGEKKSENTTRKDMNFSNEPAQSDKDFITKAKAADPSRTPSSGRSTVESTGVVVEESGRSKYDSDRTTCEDETDLKIIVGPPDDEFEHGNVDDLERQYLGRYHGGHGSG